jgi:CheY-like chemotaxis protein
MQVRTNTVREVARPQVIDKEAFFQLKQKRQAYQPPRCLVIDDNKVVLQFVARMTVRLGYQVDTAETRADVTAKLANAPYDLIITDLEMPDMNGFNLAMMIKKKHLAGKVIIMTGSYKGDCIKMMESGWADGWLFKPFGLNDLRHKIEESAPAHCFD